MVGMVFLQQNFGPNATNTFCHSVKNVHGVLVLFAGGGSGGSRISEMWSTNVHPWPFP